MSGGAKESKVLFFDKQEFLYYLNDASNYKETSILLFELEDLDKCFSIYSVDLIYQSIYNILYEINDILPNNSKMFQISNSTYCIYFVDFSMDTILEFAYSIKMLVDKIKERNVALDKPDRIIYWFSKG